MDLSTLALLLSPLLFLPLILFLLPYFLHSSPPKTDTSPALVITHTPANHSPRALAHAAALHNLTTSHPIILIAQPPSPPPSPSLIFIPIPPSPPSTSRSFFALLKKIIHNSKSFLHSLHLASLHNPTIIILNTPPILPILPLLLLIRPFYFPHARITLDLHNLAHTLMSLNNIHPILISLAEFLELLSIRFVHNHWTVSRALAEHLIQVAAIQPTVVYDRPRPPMRIASLHCAQNSPLVLRAAQALASKFGPAPPDLSALPLLVTSTSWTPDEPFDPLLDALRYWDSRHVPLLVVVTGRGPLRERYEKRVVSMNLACVAVWFVWLSADDYPRMLAAANVGISLHVSSSGLDLPMKVVDMLGCGVPVVAREYCCLAELVREGETGFLFSDVDGLIKGVQRVLWGGEGERMRRIIQKKFEPEAMTWEATWKRDALPTLVGKVS